MFLGDFAYFYFGFFNFWGGDSATLGPGLPGYVWVEEGGLRKECGSLY